MSVQNSKFPRGLRVLITMAVLAVLIWRFAINTPYYYYSIGAAALITAVVIYLTYRKPSSAKTTPKEASAKTHEVSDEEDAVTKAEAENLKPGDIVFKPAKVKSTNFNLNLSLGVTKIGDEPNKVKTSNPKSSKRPAEVEQIDEPPIPLIDDPSALTPDEKNTLVNAVWYRCENIYCKYTSFLSVHHIVEEKDGGTNKLDNLIVLCPNCHDLAHRGEIPEKEMREWISNRAERWKFKPEWKYF